MGSFSRQALQFLQDPSLSLLPSPSFSLKANYPSGFYNCTSKSLNLETNLARELHYFISLVFCKVSVEQKVIFVSFYCWWSESFSFSECIWKLSTFCLYIWNKNYTVLITEFFSPYWQRNKLRLHHNCYTLLSFPVFWWFQVIVWIWGKLILKILIVWHKTWESLCECLSALVLNTFHLPTYSLILTSECRQDGDRERQ